MNAARRAEGKLPGNLILTRDGGDHRPRAPADPGSVRVGLGVFRRDARRAGHLDGPRDGRGVDAPRLDPVGFGPAAEEAYAAWADLAAQALDGYQALYVHIKGPDVPAHDGRAEDKRDVIAAIDRAFFGEVLPRLDLRRTIVGVLADHATSCVRKAHTADPVPLVLAGGGLTSDGTTSYGEHACADGSLGELRGIDVLPTVARVAR